MTREHFGPPLQHLAVTALHGTPPLTRRGRRRSPLLRRQWGQASTRHGPRLRWTTSATSHCCRAGRGGTYEIATAALAVGAGETRSTRRGWRYAADKDLRRRWTDEEQRAGHDNIWRRSGPPLLCWQGGTAWIATAEMTVGARIAGRHCCDGSGGYAARGVSRRHAGYALRVATAVLAVGARQKSPPPRWWRRRGTHCLNDNDDNGIRTHHVADRAVSARTAAVRQTSNDGMAVAAHARRHRAAVVHTHDGPSASRLQDQTG